MKGLFRAALLAGAVLLATGASPNWLTTVTKTDGGHVLGNPNAKVKLIAFESYTCPHCRDFDKESDGPLKLAYIQPGKVSLEIRHYVRDPVDLTAAMLTQCVADNRFFDLHHKMFLAQDKWTAVMRGASKAQQDRWYAEDHSAARRAIASDFGFYDLMASYGFTAAKVDQCVSDAALAKKISDQTKADDEKYIITGTPTFALNGVTLRGTATWSLLKYQIDARL